jgi:flavin-dependent dehydrogenase
VIDRETDVAIMGGGVAGQMLARQLLATIPGLRVTIIDERELPVSRDHRGVGESTSELGAFYLKERLGLSEHLDAEHLQKFGLRFFVCEDVEHPFERRLEFGPMYPPPDLGPQESFPLDPPAFQLHRGRLEHHLCEENGRAGAEVLGGTRIVEIERADHNRHRLELSSSSGTARMLARWIIDAGGGAFSLPDPGSRWRSLDHDILAAWWWVDHKVDPHTWADSLEYRSRAPSDRRWLSTHHLCHEGHWTWVIPLPDGSTSVGILVDPEVAGLDVQSGVDEVLECLRRSEPRVADELWPRPDRPPKFRRLRARARGKIMGDGWAVTGTAAGFIDPLYSPGFDIIAILNELITRAIQESHDGDFNPERIRASNIMYERVMSHFLDVYRGSYALLGDARVYSAKFAWDQTIYFAWLCTLFMAGKGADVEFVASQRGLADRVHRLNTLVQQLLRDWHRQRGARCRPDVRSNGASPVVDQGQVPWLNLRHRALQNPHPVCEKLKEGVDNLERLAIAIFDAACADLGLNPPSADIDPYAIGLDPARWGMNRLQGSRRARARDRSLARELDYVLGFPQGTGTPTADGFDGQGPA